jgi:hypothetical protein
LLNRDAEPPLKDLETMDDDADLYDQRIAQAEDADQDKPVPRWIICARNLFSAYGIFPSEAAAWKFARARGLPFWDIDTIPLGYPKEGELDKEAFMRQLQRPKSED